MAVRAVRAGAPRVRLHLLAARAARSVVGRVPSHVEIRVAQSSASWCSGGLSKHQIVLRAAPRPASAEQPDLSWPAISGICSTQVPPPRPRGTLRVRATAAGTRGAVAGAATARRRCRGRGGPPGAAAAAACARAEWRRASRDAEWRRASRDADGGVGCAATAARATRGVAPRDAQPQRLHRLGARLGAVRR